MAAVEKMGSDPFPDTTGPPCLEQSGNPPEDEMLCPLILGSGWQKVPGIERPQEENTIVYPCGHDSGLGAKVFPQLLGDRAQGYPWGYPWKI